MTFFSFQIYFYRVSLEPEIMLLSEMNVTLSLFLTFSYYFIKSICLCGLKSILDLVIHDKLASFNQADLFDFIIQRENQVKHMLLYRERQFTKLGYSAAFILNALPYLRTLLNETHLSISMLKLLECFSVQSSLSLN